MEKLPLRNSMSNILFQAKEKQPGAIRLPIQKSMINVAFGPDTVRIKHVLAFIGAGETEPSSRQIIYESIIGLAPETSTNFKVSFGMIN
jgi:hypothetical protein